jgi:hypothetical protein
MAIAWMLLAAGAAGAASSMNLHEWMGVAPIVVSATVSGGDGRFPLVTVAQVFRGELDVSTTLQVDLRLANRERGETRSPLRLEQGGTYLFLLERASDTPSEGRTRHRLVRGVDGARPVPAEGARALLEAVATLARIQDRRDEFAAWNSFREMLEDPNPILLEIALDQHLKFRRGGVELVGYLRPLLDHPRPDLRRRAATLLGAVVERQQGKDLPDADGLRLELVGRARRDSSSEVREAAAVAVAAFDDPMAFQVLREIAREDPEQAVRYAAERLLYERGQPGSAPR